MEEHLPSLHGALGLIASTTKNKLIIIKIGTRGSIFGNLVLKNMRAPFIFIEVEMHFNLFFSCYFLFTLNFYFEIN